MSDVNDENGKSIAIVDDAVIANAQAKPILALQFLHVASSAFRKIIELGFEARACLRRQFQPLPQSGRDEDDVGHQGIYRIKRYLDQDRWRTGVLALVACYALLAPAYAVQPDEILANPAQESRARELSRELRCMVCQNQSIDDSDAPLARDLRLLVRERISAGDSNGQVMDFLVARYGEFVLLKPRFELQTLLLWLLTPVLLLGGGVALWRSNRRRPVETGADGTPLTLTADEEARLERVLAGQGTDKP
jgi:cytochrome c-type biogenesis protein CcmH